MEVNKKVKKQVLDVIKCALKEQKYTENLKNEQTVYDFIRQSGLTALFFSAIDKKFASKTFYDKLQKNFFTNVFLDTKALESVKVIKKIFDEHKIDYLFIKGTHIKHLYKQTYFRPMGDIDCLIRKKDISKTRKILKQYSFKMLAKSEAHDVYSYNNQLIEIHQKIFVKSNKKDKSVLQRPWDYANHIEGFEYRLDHTIEAVHLLYHLKKHIVSSGIGLRSVLDIPLFLNHYEKEIDKKLFEQILKEMNIYQLTQIILTFCEKAFDLKTIFLNKDFVLSKEQYDIVVNYTFTSGVHGHGKEFNPMAPRVAKGNKLSTLFKMMFPTWENMKAKYTWLKYAPFLLPFAYIIRGFQFAFLKTKYSFSKFRKLKTADEQTQSLDEVFDVFGL